MLGGNKAKNLFGRTKIYASANKDELNPLLIANILKVALPIHKENVTDISYLREVDKGDHEVYKKTKEVRKSINNQVVENHINHAVSFKKGYVFGYPAQYVQMSNNKENLPPSEIDSVNQGFDQTLSIELGLFNRLMRENDKPSKDVDLSDDLYVSGVGVRYFVGSKEGFELYNLDPTDSFVVYSNNYTKEPLFGVYMVVNTDYTIGKKVLDLKVFTESNVYTYTMPYSDYVNGAIDVPDQVKVDPEQELNVLGSIPIIEYELNKDRISIVERMLGSQNALNQITSSEVDDIEQFVNAMMVFLNADIDEDTLQLAQAMGAINIKNNGKQQGDVKLLVSKLDHGGTKVLYDRLLHNMLINVGVPLINVGGGSGGDTGLARLTDNGWLMADTKAREDELSFIQSEKTLLGAIINHLRNIGLIDKLEVNNIETKFTRHKSDNLLVKTQALQSLVGVLHPDDAFAIVELFSDPSEAMAKAKNFYGDKFFKVAEVNKDIQTEENSDKPKPLDKPIEEGKSE